MSGDHDHFNGFAVYLFSTVTREPDVVFHGDGARAKADAWAGAHGGGVIRDVVCTIIPDTHSYQDRISKLEDALDIAECKLEDALNIAECKLEDAQRTYREAVDRFQERLDSAMEDIAHLLQQRSALLNVMSVVPAHDGTYACSMLVHTLASKRFYPQEYVEQLECALGLEGVPETMLAKLRNREYAVATEGGLVVGMVKPHEVKR